MSVPRGLLDVMHENGEVGTKPPPVDTSPGTPKPLNDLPPIAQAMYNRRGQSCTSTECGQYISNQIYSHGGNKSVTNLMMDPTNRILPDKSGEVPDGTGVYFTNPDANKQHFVVAYKSADGVMRGLEDTQAGAGGGGARKVRVDRPIADIAAEHGLKPEEVAYFGIPQDSPKARQQTTPGKPAASVYDVNTGKMVAPTPMPWNQPSKVTTPPQTTDQHPPVKANGHLQRWDKNAQAYLPAEMVGPSMVPSVPRNNYADTIAGHSGLSSVADELALIPDTTKAAIGVNPKDKYAKAESYAAVPIIGATKALTAIPQMLAQIGGTIAGTDKSANPDASGQEGDLAYKALSGGVDMVSGVIDSAKRAFRGDPDGLSDMVALGLFPEIPKELHGINPLVNPRAALEAVKNTPYYPEMARGINAVRSLAAGGIENARNVLQAKIEESNLRAERPLAKILQARMDAAAPRPSAPSTLTPQEIEEAFGHVSPDPSPVADETHSVESQPSTPGKPVTPNEDYSPTNNSSSAPSDWFPVPQAKGEWAVMQSNWTHYIVPSDTGFNLYGPEGAHIGEFKSLAEADAALHPTGTPTEAPGVPGEPPAPVEAPTTPEAPKTEPTGDTKSPEDINDLSHGEYGHQTAAGHENPIEIPNNLEEVDSKVDQNKMIGSRNVNYLPDPELRKYYQDAEARGIQHDNGEPWTPEDTNEAIRKLNLPPEHLAQLPVGWHPSTIQTGVWLGAAKNADELAAIRLDKAAIEWQDNGSSTDKADPHYQAMIDARDLHDKTNVRYQRLADEWGRGGQALQRKGTPFVPDSSKNDLYKQHDILPEIKTPELVIKGKKVLGAKKIAGEKVPKSKMTIDQKLASATLGKDNVYFKQPDHPANVKVLKDLLDKATDLAKKDCKEI